MLGNEPTWTAERVRLLKSRFEAGLSCREIADDIGVSRNAVIGKLSRLNLTREKAAMHDGRRKGCRAAWRRKRCQDCNIRCCRRCMPSRSLWPRTEPIHDGHCCSLLELSEERCRWPISNPGAEDFCFCGNTPVEGCPTAQATPGWLTGRLSPTRRAGVSSTALVPAGRSTSIGKASTGVVAVPNCFTPAQDIRVNVASRTACAAKPRALGQAVRPSQNSD